MSRNQSVMLTLGFLATLNMHLLLFSYSPLVRNITDELALTNAEAGFLFSVSILTLMLFRIPWGMLFDRKGLKATMGLALVLMGVFGLVRGFAVDYTTLLASQFLLGVALSGVIPAIPKLVSYWFPREKVGFATGICMAGFPIGDVIAVGVTPYLVEAGNGWRQVFQVYGVWALLLIFLWWKFAGGEPQNMKAPASNSPNVKHAFAKLLRMKEVWLLTGLYFCAGGCYDTMLLWLPDILQVEGLNAFNASLVAAMLPVGFLVSALAVGAFSDKLGLRKPFILLMGVVSGPVLFLAGTVAGPAAYVTAFLVGLCTVGVLTLVLAVPVEMPRLSPFLSSAFGVVSSVGNLGSFLLPTLVGQLRDVSGTFLLSMVVLAVVGEGMFALGLMLPETGRKGKPNA
ncbi:MAG TPA: MFS transporter [Candidatus Bathyarchaeia archaeon]|nr:MFS transporter [Candidatus Bathyarchaeia archaeon]